MANTRPENVGTHAAPYKRNRKRIFATQSVCGICGQPVDFSLKFPDPMSKCIDHIIPINKGGHPSDISNLQLAHLCCNRQKSDKLFRDDMTSNRQTVHKEIGNQILPHSIDWRAYSSKN